HTRSGEKSGQTRTGERGEKGARGGERRTDIEVRGGRRDDGARTGGRTRVDIGVGGGRRAGGRDADVNVRGYGYTAGNCQEIIRRYRQCVARRVRGRSNFGPGRTPGPSLSAALITQPKSVAGSSQPQQPLRNVHGIRALGPALSIELSRKRKCVARLTLDPSLTLHVLGRGRLAFCFLAHQRRSGLLTLLITGCRRLAGTCGT